MFSTRPSRMSAEKKITAHYAGNPAPCTLISLAATIGITYTYASLTARLLVAKGILTRTLGEDGRTILYSPATRQESTNG